MRKNLFLFCCMIAMGLSAIAVDPPKGTTRCKLPGTYDYVTVDYFNEGYGEGYLVFANQSNMTIARMHVKVEVRDTWNEEVTKYNQLTHEEVTTTVTKHRIAVLCDDTFYDIPCCRSEKRTSSSRGPVKGGNEKNGHTYDYTVTIIDDPICKPE